MVCQTMIFNLISWKLMLDINEQKQIDHLPALVTVVSSIAVVCFEIMWSIQKILIMYKYISIPYINSFSSFENRKTLLYLSCKSFCNVRWEMHSYPLFLFDWNDMLVPQNHTRKNIDVEHGSKILQGECSDYQELFRVKKHIVMRLYIQLHWLFLSLVSILLLFLSWYMELRLKIKINLAYIVEYTWNIHQ